LAARKDEARTKIAFGGLLKLSALWGETDSVVLGALRRVRQLLDGPDGSEMAARFRTLGRAKFSQIEEEKLACQTQGSAPEEVRRERNHILIRRGALVIKAGLDREEERVILGVMISAGIVLSRDDGAARRAEWQAAGEAEMPIRDAGEKAA
jgi:hypothetical protein